MRWRFRRPGPGRPGGQVLTASSSSIPTIRSTSTNRFQDQSCCPHRGSVNNRPPSSQIGAHALGALWSTFWLSSKLFGCTCPVQSIFSLPHHLRTSQPLSNSTSLTRLKPHNRQHHQRPDHEILTFAFLRAGQRTTVHNIIVSIVTLADHHTPGALEQSPINPIATRLIQILIRVSPRPT